MMNELLLQMVWREQLFYNQNLKTTSGKPIKIICPGKHNLNAGPDFFNGKIQIGKLTIVGNIEIHTKTSEWNDHKHQFDKAYNNVVLHVVYDNNIDIYNERGETIETLELRNYISDTLFENVDNLLASKDINRCSYKLDKMNSISRISFLDSLMIDRLKRKAQEIIDFKLKQQIDWNQMFLISLASAFGLPANKEPMMQLMSLVDHLTLMKRSDQFYDIESLLFGTAGFLKNEKGCDYHDYLRKNYLYLKTKYQLNFEMDVFQWKFSRMRMYSFPSFRLGLFSSFLFERINDLLVWMDSPSFDQVSSYLNISVFNYWQHHYEFNKPLKTPYSEYSKDFKLRLYVNTFVPFHLAYHKFKSIDVFESELMSLPKECNNLTKTWLKNCEIKNLWDSQAILELDKSYCNAKKCLTCNIGKLIIKDEQSIYKNKGVFGITVFRSLPMVG